MPVPKSLADKGPVAAPAPVLPPPKLPPVPVVAARPVVAPIYGMYVLESQVRNALTVNLDSYDSAGHRGRIHFKCAGDRSRPLTYREKESKEVQGAIRMGIARLHRIP